MDVLLAHPRLTPYQMVWGRTAVVAAARRALDRARGEVAAGRRVPALDELAGIATRDLDALAAGRLRAVINATGVVLHTNLGRAPLSPAAREAVAAAAGYCTVEFDLRTGSRSRRGSTAHALLRELTGAPAALAVNNAAAGLLLTLSALARDQEVVVSRGELIEIGGEFRLPAIMEAAGVRLVEVGTTNRTHLRDYADAITGRTALLLVVHASNYRIEGFTARPPLPALVRLATDHAVPLLHDLGSGLLDSDAIGTISTERTGSADSRGTDPRGTDPRGTDPRSTDPRSTDPRSTGTSQAGYPGSEPTLADSLRAGVDLALFSGDKLFGGPQAGLLVGREDLVSRLARHPVARAVRIDKLTLAALEATLLAHLAGRRDELPVWQALTPTPEDLRPRAERLARRLGRAAALRAGDSVAGGGSLPGEGLPSVLIDIDPAPASEVAVLARLRAADPPVVARAERGRVVVDLRTVPSEQDEILTGILQTVLNPAPSIESGG